MATLLNAPVSCSMHQTNQPVSSRLACLLIPSKAPPGVQQNVRDSKHSSPFSNRRPADHVPTRSFIYEVILIAHTADTKVAIWAKTDAQFARTQYTSLSGLYSTAKQYLSLTVDIIIDIIHNLQFTWYRKQYSTTTGHVGSYTNHNLTQTAFEIYTFTIPHKAVTGRDIWMTFLGISW